MLKMVSISISIAKVMSSSLRALYLKAFQKNFLPLSGSGTLSTTMLFGTTGNHVAKYERRNREIKNKYFIFLILLKPQHLRILTVPTRAKTYLKVRYLLMQKPT